LIATGFVAAEHKTQMANDADGSAVDSGIGRTSVDIVWDGITQKESLTELAQQARHDLADAAQRYHWERVLEIVSASPDLVNSVRLGGSSRFTPLHQAAHGNAPLEVINALIALKASRAIQNARGERPIDVAQRHGNTRVAGVLAPQYRRHVPNGILLKIEAHFHAVVRGRARDLVENQQLRLPQLELLLELDDPHMWFPVPGMYGGFSYRLEADGVQTRLVAESWCRVEGGSGQRHEIDTSGSRLVDEGFV
jgi:hypothetical protein